MFLSLHFHLICLVHLLIFSPFSVTFVVVTFILSNARDIFPLIWSFERVWLEVGFSTTGDSCIASASLMFLDEVSLGYQFSYFQ